MRQIYEENADGGGTGESAEVPWNGRPGSETRGEENNAVPTGRLEDLPLLDASALAPGVRKRIVFGPGRFWKDWVVRYFILPPGGTVPVHVHDWDHFAVALQGTGRLVVGDVTSDFSQGYWGHVPPGIPHSFENAGNEPLAFLCIVPTQGDPHAKRTLGRLQRRQDREEVSGTP